MMFDKISLVPDVNKRLEVIKRPITLHAQKKKTCRPTKYLNNHVHESCVHLMYTVYTSWYSYEMVTQKMLRTHEGKKGLFQNNNRICYFSRSNKTCAPISELPSYISTMITSFTYQRTADIN